MSADIAKVESVYTEMQILDFASYCLIEGTERYGLPELYAFWKQGILPPTKNLNK